MKLIKEIYKEANEFIAPDEKLLEKILAQADKPQHSPMTRRMYMAGSLAAGVAAVAVSAAVFPQVMKYSDPQVAEKEFVNGMDIEDRVKESYGLFREMQPSDVPGQSTGGASPLPKLGVSIYPGEGAEYVPGADTKAGDGTQGEGAVIPTDGTAVMPRVASGDAVSPTTQQPSTVQTAQPEIEQAPVATPAVSEGASAGESSAAEDAYAPSEIPAQEDVQEDEVSSNAMDLSGENAAVDSYSASSGAGFGGGGGGSAPMMGSVASSSSIPARALWTLDGLEFNRSENIEGGTVYYYSGDGRELSVQVEQTLSVELEINDEVNGLSVQLSEEEDIPVLRFDLNGSRYTLKGEGMTADEIKQVAAVIAAV